MSTDHSADTDSPSVEPIGSLAPQTGGGEPVGPQLGLGGTAWTIPAGMGGVPELVALGATTLRPGQATMFAAACPGLRTTGRITVDIHQVSGGYIYAEAFSADAADAPSGVTLADVYFPQHAEPGQYLARLTCSANDPNGPLLDMGTAADITITLQPSGFVTPGPDPTMTLDEGRAAGYVEGVNQLTWLAEPSGRPGDALPFVAYCVQSRSDGVNHGGWLRVGEEASALKYPIQLHAWAPRPPGVEGVRTTLMRSELYIPLGTPSGRYVGELSCMIEDEECATDASDQPPEPVVVVVE